MSPRPRASALRSLTAFAAAVLLLAPGLASAATHPFSVKDMVMMDRVSDPHVSPDGRWLVYGLRTTDWDANKGVQSIWLLDLKDRGAAPYRLPASGSGASNPEWSPDSQSIYFISSRSGSDQIWRTSLDGTRAQQVTKLPLDVLAYRPSPDGSRLVVSLAVFPDCESPDCTRARIAANADGKPSGVLYKRLFVRHWDNWADGTRNHLFALKRDFEGRALDQPTPLMRGFDGDTPSKPFGDDHDFAVTPDGKAVIFSAKLAGRTEAWSTNFDLWRAPIDGSASSMWAGSTIG